MEISNELQVLLNGEDLADKQHIAMMLQSVNDEGYPHTAMISVGEIVAMNNHTLRLALWPKTQTVQNLINRKKANLVIVYHQKVFYLELDVMLLESITSSTYDRTYFEIQVNALKKDVAKYATIVSGITVDLHEPDKVINRWETTVNDMRQV